MTAHTNPSRAVYWASHSSHLEDLQALVLGELAVWAALQTGIATLEIVCQWKDSIQIGPSVED